MWLIRTKCYVRHSGRKQTGRVAVDAGLRHVLGEASVGEDRWVLVEQIVVVMVHGLCRRDS
jgi:hypothetical protein